MTSPQHAKWIRSGLQWQLARPLVALRDRLRAYGYTVYDMGDSRHLDHIPPEDHTPYSETGWPGSTPYGWVTAIDIMPPGGGGLPSLAKLGAQLYADKQAGGLYWLKYMNWEPGDGNCWHDSWQPGHKRVSSGDRGHIHLSCRSDVATIQPGATVLGYDPVARLRGQNGDDMAGEIADKALKQLDGGNALGDVYLRLLTGRDNHGAPSGDGAADANLTEIVALLHGLQAAVAKLGSPAAVSASEVVAELKADPEFRQLLVDAANTAEDS